MVAVLVVACGILLPLATHVVAEDGKSTISFVCMRVPAVMVVRDGVPGVPGVPGVAGVAGVTGEHGEHRYAYDGASVFLPLFLSLVVVVVVAAEDAGMTIPGDSKLDVRDDDECSCKGMAKGAGDGHRLRVVDGL